jgi:hypothetical protein
VKSFDLLSNFFQFYVKKSKEKYHKNMSDYIEIDGLSDNTELTQNDKLLIRQEGIDKKATLGEIKDFVYPPEASNTATGLVNQEAQAFSGQKTFSGGIATPTLLATKATITDIATVQGDLHVNGNIIQQGESIETNVETLKVKDQLLVTRDGATVGMASDEVTGIKATMYDGENDGLLVFGADGVARVGDEGDTQPLATREETPNGVAVWDDTNKRFKTVTGPEGTTLTIIDGQPTFEAEGENRKGYMPLYAPYLQLPLFPEPQEIFYGEWEDITHLYAGLFMRFAGGEATEFNKQLEVLTQSGTTLTFADNHGITTQCLLIDTATGERRAVTAVSGNTITVDSAFSTNLTTVLIGQNEGLPNIKGGTGQGFAINGAASEFDPVGAFFSPGTTGKRDSLGSGNYNMPRLSFDASRSNPIYGANTHVTPFNLSTKVWKRVK